MVPGKPDESLLVEAINYEGPEMPPAGKLGPEQDRRPDALGLAGRPLAQRAIAPHAHAVPTAESPVSKAGPDRGIRSRPSGRSSPSADPSIPRSRASSIDRLGRLVAKPDRSIHPAKALLEHGLTPAAEADESTLIRRVTFDLTGLPPDARGGRRVPRR